MKKQDKPKTRDENEDRVYRFAKALIAVPKKELDKQLDKHGEHKLKVQRGLKSRA